jgi:hypothetical protein
VERTSTQGRRQARLSRQGRFARGSTGKAQAPRRFPQAASRTEPGRRFGRAGGGARGSRHRHPEPSAAQKLTERIQGMLPGGGKSAKRGRRSSGLMSGLGGLLSTRGANKRRTAGRGRKSAIFGLVGAGAAGAAAAAAKRRRGSRPSTSPMGETSGQSEPQTPSTATTTSAHPRDMPSPGEMPHASDTPAAGEERD